MTAGLQVRIREATLVRLTRAYERIALERTFVFGSWEADPSWDERLAVVLAWVEARRGAEGLRT